MVSLIRKPTSAKQLPGALWKSIISYRYFYLLLLLPIAYYIIFAYLPMYGVTLAFKQFRYDTGLFNSPWVGTKYFVRLFTDRDFLRSIQNTLIISFTKIGVYFPVPILLALMLNEFKNSRLKAVYQTVFTFPHFLSWVVVSGIIINMLSSKGIVNQILASMGQQSIGFLTETKYFRSILYSSQIWKESGWDSIIYLAALAGINPEIYEASDIDGANRLQKIAFITWPGIKGTVTIMLILAIGGVMNANFDQVFNLYSSSIYSVADIIDTYVYRQAFKMTPDFSYATAVGFFKSVVSLALVFLSNTVSKRLFREEGIV